MGYVVVSFNSCYVQDYKVTNVMGCHGLGGRFVPLGGDTFSQGSVQPVVDGYASFSPKPGEVNSYAFCSTSLVESCGLGSLQASVVLCCR